ncbi:M1 family metallopeptidase [Salinimicrobium soli]|uniref:M1 family metallopeptidase n=2 Tax=Bacteria TaxID=2 RepID=UPI003AAE2249
MRFFTLFIFFAFITISPIKGQVLSHKKTYTEADTLRGSLRPERNFDVLKYHLNVKVDPAEKYISGSNTITFKAEEDLPVMQIDLFANMAVDSILYRGQKLNYTRRYNAVFIDMDPSVRDQKIDSLQFYYSGYPVIARNAPWDGGFVFTQDKEGNPWIGIAVQGTGASLWYPNKDHQSDEPEEVLIEAAVPNDLMNVSNGRFLAKKDLGNGYTQWNWKVNSPINNYNVMLNIGNYVHFSDKYQDLDLDYYVLPYNLEKAKEQFAEVKDMMACFYEKLGPYPFEEDGFKLIETPYLGMEHQSAVAYGNGYKMGYRGTDLSGTGIGLKWDFIIIHESGHEWYGNSLTAADIADMWLHEGFTTYSEAVYIECRWGKEEALEYLRGLQQNIMNDIPMIGPYGVNKEGSGDMYPKGANLLNTIRSIYDNDSLWWKTLKDYTQHFRHQTIQTEQTEAFFDAATPIDLKPVFDQYLRHTNIPQLQLKTDGEKLFYRWKADVPDFKMPVDVCIKNKEVRLFPTPEWQQLKEKFKDAGEVKVNDLKFYVDTVHINNLY